MKESRLYQEMIENEIPYKLKEFKHILVQAPTGSGKSHIINKTVKRILKAGKTPLVLSDSLTIHEQLAIECGAWPIVSAMKHIHVLPAMCYVAMSQTLIRRNPVIEQFKELGDKLVLIVDEAHINTMSPIIRELTPIWLIGFTATPHYKWAKHLPEFYNAIIVGPTIKQLQKSGHLAEYRHVIRTRADLAGLEQNKDGEFTEESNDRAFGANRIYDGLFDDLPEFQKKKTVIYVASIKLCEKIYQECLLHGYKATRWHSNLGGDISHLKQFTDGDADICVSVSSLTKGWDFPPIDLVVMWRATSSLVLYLQMLGRGSRPYPGKPFFTCLDYGSNYERLGAWNMDRDWEELWKPQVRKISTYAGVGGSKECPVCHWLMPVSVRSCPNCGYIYSQEEMRLVVGQLVEVENSLKAIEQRNVSSYTPQELATYAKLKQKRNHAIRIAKSMEQQKPGFLKEFAKIMGYAPGWVQYQLNQMPRNGSKITFFDSFVK